MLTCGVGFHLPAGYGWSGWFDGYGVGVSFGVSGRHPLGQRLYWALLDDDGGDGFGDWIGSDRDEIDDGRCYGGKRDGFGQGQRSSSLVDGGGADLGDGHGGERNDYFIELGDGVEDKGCGDGGLDGGDWRQGERIGAGLGPHRGDRLSRPNDGCCGDAVEGGSGGDGGGGGAH